MAFLTPTISTGGGPGGGGPGGGNSGGLVISAPSTPSLANGNNVTNGTSHFEGKCYVSGNGGTEGISDVRAEGVTMRIERGRIVVEGCEGCSVQVYDIGGHPVSGGTLSPGIYLVRVGNLPTRKVVVM